MVINVQGLCKNYRIFKKNPGIHGLIQSMLWRKYEDVHAVQDISFEISEGELVGFIGPNGAGKTTTLKCLSGLLYPSGGSVSILGYTPFQRKKEFLSHIALVMGQKNQLWWDLPAMDTFLLNKTIYTIEDKKFQKTLGELVELLDVSSLLHIPVRKLSLGERMKMELISSLLHQPNVLFLDEPTIGLDVVMQKQLRDFIRNYNQQHKATILLTSHYMEDVRQLADRIIIIDHGSLLYDGHLDQLIKKYAKHKILSVVLNTYVQPKKLTSIGTVLTYTYPKVTIQVMRNKSNEAAVQLLKKFPVEDLNIEEPDIEDIIRDVFAQSR